MKFFRKIFGCKTSNIKDEEIVKLLSDLKDTTLEDIMIPRVDIISVDYKLNLKGIIDVINKTGHSKIPVFQNNVDNIIGVIYMEDLLRLWGIDFNVSAAEVMKLPYFLPSSNGILETIEYMKKERISLVFVVNEYGTVVGLVTMEDLMESFVGEIDDEFAIPEEEIEREEDGYIVSTSIEIERLNEEIDSDFPESEDYNTLGGLIYTVIERIPKNGEKFEINGYEFKVIESTSQHVKKVFIKKKESGDER